MEAKFSDIETQLAELKVNVVVPDYSGLLGKFAWTREWFANVEEVLVALAYRGESDRYIIDFIRAKVRETDVITFNKFMELVSAKKVVNHYELLIDSEEDRHLILSNPNKKIVDAALKYYINVDECNASDLNECVSDRAVSYLLENPHLINWSTFKQNSNIRAVKHCIANGAINSYLISGIDDDEFIRELLKNPEHIDLSSLSANPNNIAVDYVLNQPMRLSRLSKNTNDRVVDYLIANPQYINYALFSFNVNEKAIDHMLQNKDLIAELIFFHIDNKKVADYMLTQLHRIDPVLLSVHPDDRIVDHMLANQSLIHWDYICMNPNDRAVEYALKHVDQIYLFENNVCEYNAQKIKAFNAAGIFPRLPHLRL